MINDESVTAVDEEGQTQVWVFSATWWRGRVRPRGGRWGFLRVETRAGNNRLGPRYQQQLSPLESRQELMLY